MTTALQAIRAKVVSVTAITQLLSAADAVYAEGIAPPKPTPPYLTIDQLAQPGQHHLQGVGGTADTLFQVGCWAAEGTAAEAIADAVEAALDGFRGTLTSGTTSRGVFKSDRRGPISHSLEDGSPFPILEVQIDFRLWR